MTINEKDILQIIEVEINSIFEKNFKRLFPFDDENFENKLKDTIKIKVKNQIVYLLNLNNYRETLIERIVSWGIDREDFLEY